MIKADNNIYFLMSSDCSHCQSMYTSIFNNKELVRYLQKNYIVHFIDTNNKIPYKLQKYYNGTTPTTLIFKDDKELIGYPFEGEIESRELLKLLKNIKLQYY